MISAIKELAAVVTHILEPFSTSVKTTYKIIEGPITAMVDGSITTKNKNISTATTIHIFVHVTIAFLLPHFPAYLAPITANMMEGAIPITLSMVPSPIFPIRMPESMVVITAWEAVCCAILSDACAAI